MSRSQPTTTNPSQRYFKWSGSKGSLIYWDKEQEKEITVKLPFDFLVLDQLTTMTGWSDQQESAFWSNEVRRTTDELVVRTKNGIQASGAYKDLGDVKSKGAKYAKSVYIAFKNDEGFVIGNLKASGAALTSWIEFCNKVNVMNGKVSLTGSTEAKKGATTYFIPTFELLHAESDEDSIAIELDKELQTYLNQSLTVADSSRDSQEPLPEYQETEFSVDDIPNEWA